MRYIAQRLNAVPSKILMARLAITLAIFLLGSPFAHAQVSNTASTTTAISAVISSLILEDCFIPFFAKVECEQVIQTQEQVDALDGITQFDGDLYISGRTNLDFGAFDQLEEITGSLYFLYGRQNSIVGFNSLTSVGGEIEIIENSKLTTIDGFDSLETASFLLITDNQQINMVNGFHQLTTVPGSLWLRDNPLLELLVAFESLQSVGGLNLSRMALSALPSFSNLTRVYFEDGIYSAPDQISINNLPALTTLPLFNSVTTASSIGLSNLNLVTLIPGFNNIETLIDGLYIADNPELISIAGFTGLTKIGDDNGNTDSLVIKDNVKLTTVTGLTSLPADGVDDDKVVSGNTALDCPTEFMALEPLTASTGNSIDCDDN